MVTTFQVLQNSSTLCGNPTSVAAYIAMHTLLSVHDKCQCIFYKNSHDDLTNSKIQVKAGNSLLKTGVAPYTELARCNLA